MSEERAPYQSRPTGSTRKPTDREMITRAVALLRAGILTSAIPGRLMDEYGLTPERARLLATQALKQQSDDGIIVVALGWLAGGCTRAN